MHSMSTQPTGFDFLAYVQDKGLPQTLAIKYDGELSVRHAQIVAITNDDTLVARIIRPDSPGYAPYLAEFDRTGREKTPYGHEPDYLVTPKNPAITLLEEVREKLGVTGFKVLRLCLQNGQLIISVKYIRELTGRGITEAKTAAEFLRDNPHHFPEY